MTEEEQEEYERQLENIRCSLSELSNSEELPKGYRDRPVPFEPTEVEFESASWLLRLNQVSAWLALSVELGAPEGDTFQFVRDFFAGMGHEDADALLLDSDGIPALTLDGATLLSDRLEVAVELKGVFEASLEEGSRSSATNEWMERWGEEAAIDSQDPAPVKAKTDLWPIQEFAGKAKKNQLNLSPTYQRGDVWPTSFCQQLIESVLRGIPLPSIILLRPQAGKGTGPYEVVDGKQRLTSILRFMGQHPIALGVLAGSTPFPRTV